MKIIIIGNMGSGKSTLAKKVQGVTWLPLLQLDSLWHSTDYSAKAKQWFIDQQRLFMKQNNEWIIEGNYEGSLKQRITNANLIVWLKVAKTTAVFRVIRRSIRFRKNRQYRSEMPNSFSEHFDREYLEFLKSIWSYNDDSFCNLIQKYKSNSCEVIVIKTAKEKRMLLSQLNKH
ncbi:topology modulation protein [Liquorilactobacillus satsumensis]|uniref:topology modulation protein n=1 Tax=Liquorilactobacillus satsumensis TaxID=259059 RepID=UPI0039ED8992